MPHPLIAALFSSPAAAEEATRALHAAGVTGEHISIVSRNHDEEVAFARQADATPGVEIEDSRPAARLGEFSGQLLAAIALVLPGIGPIVAAGPLSAGLGEAAGHVAGGVASALTAAGVDHDRAEALQKAIEEGAVLVGVHTVDAEVARLSTVLRLSGATVVETANWNG